MNAKLRLIENQEEIEKRWEQNDDCYKCALSINHLSKAKDTYNTVMQLVRERWFLLSVKARFAEGHVMASRISRRIGTVHQKVKQLIEKYNSLRSRSRAESDLPESLNWDIVTNQQSCSQHFPDKEASVPPSIQRTAIDQTHLIHRCDEEVELVKREMLSTYNFLLKHHNLILQKLQQRNDDTQFNRGVVTLLRSKLLFIELQLVQCHSSFSSHVEITAPPSIAQNFVFDTSLDIFSLHEIMHIESPHHQSYQGLGNNLDELESLSDEDDFSGVQVGKCTQHEGLIFYSMQNLV